MAAVAYYLSITIEINVGMELNDKPCLRSRERERGKTPMHGSSQNVTSVVLYSKIYKDVT